MNHYFSLLLHAHLPYVYHPEHTSYLEENWLYEAISETYIPLLQMLDRLERDGVFCRLAVSLSPPLLAMLDHPDLQLRYLEYLETRIALCRSLLQSWQCNQAEKRALQEYIDFYLENQRLFEKKYERKLIPAFRYYRNMGMLELLCSSATHAFLPNFQQYPRLVRQQVRLAIASFEKYFGPQRGTLGFWLPECGYYDGLDKILLQEGVRYCYISLHGLQGDLKLPENGSFSPVQSSDGLIFFPQERTSSAIIWDEHIGFPGAKVYRDFYQDVGYRADLSALKEHLPFGLRYYTGIKLWRIEQKYTQTGQKQCDYQISKAKQQAESHAQIFLQHLYTQSEKASSLMDRPPLINAAYDAELFGHWWFEGPHFIEQVFRIQHANAVEGLADKGKNDKGKNTKDSGDKDGVKLSGNLEFLTPSEYLAREHKFQNLRPCFSSWGRDGYAQVWLDQQNDWIYPQLFEAYENIEALLSQKSIQSTDGKHSSHEYGPYQQQAVRQLVREFTLACASDWAFMMKSDTNKDYAINRTNEHLQNVFHILQCLVKKKIDQEWLSQLRKKHRIFLNLPIEKFFL